jgi:hypothetical protein
VARLGLGRLIARRPRRRVGQFRFELLQRGLGLLDRPLRLLLLAEAVLRRSLRPRLGLPARARAGHVRRCGELRPVLARTGAPAVGAAARSSRAVARRGRAAGGGRRAERSGPAGGGGAALVTHTHVLGPAADVAAQRPVLDGDRARAHRVQQSPVVGHEQDRAGKGPQRVLERLAALDVEMVGGLIEDQHVGCRLHEHRQRQAPALAAGQAAQRLLGLLAGEQEAPKQRARLARAQARRALRGVEHALLRWPTGAQLVRVLGEVTDLHVVARAELARRERPAARERLDQRRLAGAVRAHERDVLAALEPQLGVLEQDEVRAALARADFHAPVLQLEDHAPAALGRGECELQSLDIRSVPLDPLDLLQPLDPRLRLARLRGLVAKALDEPLHPLDLGLLSIDRATERELAGGLLASPLMPRPGEEARAAGL